MSLGGRIPTGILAVNTRLTHGAILMGLMAQDGSRLTGPLQITYIMAMMHRQHVVHVAEENTVRSPPSLPPSLIIRRLFE